MQTLSLYQEFDLHIYEAAQWTLPLHNHNFFELIYILEGEGTHILNNNKFEYRQESLFFLTPHDAHTFEIALKSKFCIITFSKIYFSRKDKPKSDLNDFSNLFKKLEFIFYNHNFMEGDPIKVSEDKKLIKVLITQLIQEMETKSIFFETMVQNIVFLLLNIIARNIHQHVRFHLQIDQAKNSIHDITTYIQQNIYDNAQLTLESIAAHFSKSKDYIGQYFKKHTDNTLKNYILTYKLNLVKTRLVYSDLTISEIAHELNFTDESHLNKIFKQFYNQTAKTYRKMHQTK